MDSVTIKAYAKINLFLEILDKRIDNYHNIDSVMQTISLHDLVTVSKSNAIKINNNAGLPNDRSNLAYKAAELFLNYYNIDCGCEIYIQKNIPISAGLAGGSTDAAAVLCGLNTVYNINADLDELCRLGSKLGADVPFCIKGGTCITKGIGDLLTPCSSIRDCHIVISKSGEGVSTPYAYGEIDKMREQIDYSPKTSDLICSALKSGDLYNVCSNMYNAFESVICSIRPKVDEQKNIMLNNNAVFSMMSGSGPSVFGIFDDKSNAENALSCLKVYGADAHICSPIGVCTK